MESVAKTTFLKTAEEAFIAITNDAEVRPHLSRYCYALLDSLGLHQHPVQKSLQRRLATTPKKKRADIASSVSAEREPFLLSSLAARVEHGFPRFKQVFEEDLPQQVRRFTCFYLSDATADPHAKEVLHQAGLAIPLHIDRPWDNPIRFIKNPTTGHVTFGDVEARTALSFVIAAQGLAKAVEPARRVGRPKGIEKPKKSGKAPLPVKESREVFRAMEGGKDWKYCARHILNRTIPTDSKQRDNLRKYVDRLRFNGAKLSRQP